MSISRQSREITRTKAYYEKYAEIWTKTHADSFHDEKEFRYLKNLIGPKSSVVDIGCAAGVLVPLFLGIGKGLRYHGFDIAQKFIAIATRRYPQLPFSYGNITDQSTLPKMKFDAFIARSVLMHLPLSRWNNAFENIEKITKMGAYGYVVLPTNRPPSQTPDSDTRHFTLLSEKEQSKFFKDRNWNIVKKFKHATGPHKANWIGYIVKLP
jgi:SAM-dependent methyltransferase